MSSHNWGPLGTAAMIGIETSLERARQTYIRGFTWLVIASVLMVTLGVALNKHGYLLANFYLAAGFLVAWAFFTFYPAAIISIFGIGGLSGLPKDWSINRFLREGMFPDLELSNVAKEGFSLIRKYVGWSSHLALFVVVVFVTLGTWRIERGSIVLPVFIVLAGIGFWAALFAKGSVWYKRVTLAILLVSLAGLIYAGYVYMHPQDETVALIDETIMKNEDLIKERAAKALHEKVRQGIALTPEEIRLLESLRHESRRVTNVVSGVTASLPMVLSSSGKPAEQTWNLYKRVRDCSVGWNAQESGPWCNAIELPAGSYRIKPRFIKMWQHGNTSLADGNVSYHDIPAKGIMLQAIWNKNEEFYDEFLRMAPLGGNMWFGRLVVRVGDKLMHDPFEHGWFTITEPTKVLVGINIPPLEQYVAIDRGELPFDIERLRP